MADFQGVQHNGRRASARFAIVVVAAFIGGEAKAQTYVRPDCQPHISAPRLDPSPPTAGWYRRFWTGDCQGLRGCVGGSPNWNEIVGKLVTRSTAAERPAVLAKACSLGPLIGQEWTRPREIRRIDSGDLRKFQRALGSAGDVLKGIELVDAQARAKIGTGR